MLKAKSGAGIDLLIWFREIVVESFRIIFFDLKEYYRFSYYNTAVFNTALKHIRI